MPADDSLPPELTSALSNVRSVGVITGAGISAESGIQTYRGKGGVYDDPEEGDKTVESLSGETLASDPDRTWRTVARLAEQSQEARPNRGHLALVDIEKNVERFCLLTQNVDGLHRAAGSKSIIEIHGDTFDTVCIGCGARGRVDSPASITKAPQCSGCGGVIRPDVVLFGEMLPMEKLQRIRHEFYNDPPDLVVVAGTSALFPYIAEPVLVARATGRLTIEVNPEPTVLTDAVRWSFRKPAGRDSCRYWRRRSGARIRLFGL